jgi:hypothetical protein
LRRAASHLGDVQLLTKWVPDTGTADTRNDVRATSTAPSIGCSVDAIDLMQFHTWNYDDPSRGWTRCSTSTS